MLTSEDVTVVAMATIVAWHTVVLVVSWFRQVNVCTVPKTHVGGCTTWGHFRIGGCASWKSHRQRSKELPDVEQCRLADMRVESYREMVKIWMHVCGFYAVNFLIRHPLGHPRVCDGVMVSFLLTSYASSFILRVFPSLTHKDSLWLVHIWGMGLLFCFGAYVAFSSTELFSHFNTQMLILRAVLSMAYPVAWLNFGWNLAWVVVSSNGSFTGTGVQLDKIVINEICVALFLSYLVSKIELLQVSLVRSDNKVIEFSQAKNTFGRLSANMCDVVVELDQRLDIQHPSPKLADLTLNSHDSKALKGERFTSLAYGFEDRDRFDEFVSQGAIPIEPGNRIHSDARASSVYLNLKDAFGMPVPVQVFHDCHRDLLGKVCHVIGIHKIAGHIRTGGAGHPIAVHHGMRESREGARQATVSEGGVGTGGLDNTARGVSSHAGGGDDVDAVVHPASGTSHHGVNDTDIPLVPLLPEGQVLGRVAVIFDPLNDKIVATTIGFQAFTGPLMYQAQIKDFVVNYDAFQAWVNGEVYGYFEDAQPNKFQLDLTSSLSQQQRIPQFHANAYIVEVHKGVRVSQWAVLPPEGVDDEVFELLCVMFLDYPQPCFPREQRQPTPSTERIELEVAPRVYGV